MKNHTKQPIEQCEIFVTWCKIKRYQMNELQWRLLSWHQKWLLALLTITMLH